jgi:hypothetical protein
MKWKVYASREQRKADPGAGVELEGQSWGAAPGSGQVWAVTDDQECHLVTCANPGRGGNYEIDGGCPAIVKGPASV